MAEICEWVDEKSKGHFTWDEKQLLAVSPISWRDGIVVKAAEEMVKMQRDEMHVNLDRVLGNSDLGLFDMLKQIERQMAKAQDVRPQAGVERRREQDKGVVLKDTILESLESFHKVLVMYMWMHLRNSVVYPDYLVAEDLKHRVEVVMDWALQQMGKKNIRNRWEKVARYGDQPSQSLGHSRIVDKLPPLPHPVTAPIDQPQSKIGYKTSGGAQVVRQWGQPPDLSTLLKQYVDSSRLKAGGGTR